jgi:DeoR/GlpR family transcriptional regulator of sugar metabolism
MLKEERQQHILGWLQKDRKVILSDLSRQLKVSADTVRRDIKELSAQKLLKEVRGGAIPHAPGPHDLKERANFASRQKQLMAKKAVQLLKQGHVVLLDSGTSTLAVASILPKNLGLTIFTNSYPIVNMLEERKDVDVFFAGGRLFRESMITIGQDAITFFEGIRADICFLGICSIDLELGLTGHHYEECAVKKAMIKSSGKVIALSTPEKLNTAEAFHIAPIQALSGMITSSPEIDLLNPYRNAGINII